MKQQINFKSLLVIICLLLSFNLQAQDVPPVTINVATAGTLPSLIASTKKYQITNLTVTGNLNGTDIRYIREMAGCDFYGLSTTGKLSVLDLSGAYISAGGSYYYYNTGANVKYYTSNSKIEDYSFCKCTGLTSITIPNSVISIGDNAFQGCTGLVSITIGNGVTSIGDYAFQGCSISLLNFNPTNFTSFGTNAFTFQSSLKTVNIGDNVKTLPNSLFSGCTGLTSITIPNGVTSIGNFAFSGCTGLTSITIPDSVTSIGEAAFSGCTGLTSITIGNSVTSIGSSAFSSCTGVTSVTIPNSVTSMNNAFSGCTKLKEFVVLENNTTYRSIEGVLFSKDCTKLVAYPNAKSNIYTLPSNVTSIGNSAFSGCTGLTSITIGNSVTSIGSSAFSSCTGVTSVIIPNNVTSIGDYAFYYCTKIAEIHCKAITPPFAASYSFKGLTTTCKLYVPKGAYSSYWIAPIWGDFTNIIEEESTAITQTKANNLKVYTEQDAIVIIGAELEAEISVYTESGAFLQTTRVTDNTIRIAVPVNHTYLIRTTGKTFKVAL